MHLSMCVEMLAVIHAIAEGGVLAEGATHVLSSVMLASDLKITPSASADTRPAFCQTLGSKWPPLFLRGY